MYSRFSNAFVSLLCFPLFLGAQATFVPDSLTFITTVIDSVAFSDRVSTIPSFTIYGDNYFLTGSTLGESPASDNSDAKFQIGFKQRLTNKKFLWGSYLFFTYRQKVFWDIYKESYPFRETNYNPSLALFKPFFKDSKFHSFLQVQFEHESNGRDGANSRSWNFFSATYNTYISDNLSGSLKIWIPLKPPVENKNITEFRGYQQLDLAYRLNKNIIFDTEIRKAPSFDWKGSLVVGASYRISQRSNQFIYLQYYMGYSEELITFDESTYRLRIGIAFKDLFMKFRGKQ
ncbi:phospholipase A [Ulvibacterium marinum]|uniref:Phosphatidylcholine 1-acylhydrolase n=1 Tax=Ulvibacterium marinum TaxID=2419782 RepID=A0A3B0C2G7_9FLAO|nr:phospholipase A [Ulvibacterium marinum]RKN78684.1 phospholipase [Ulvibacterium marinum]